MCDDKSKDGRIAVLDDEVERMTVCSVCGKRDPDGLEACSECYAYHFQRGERGAARVAELKQKNIGLGRALAQANSRIIAAEERAEKAEQGDAEADVSSVEVADRFSWNVASAWRERDKARERADKLEAENTRLGDRVAELEAELDVTGYVERHEAALARAHEAETRAAELEAENTANNYPTIAYLQARLTGQETENMRQADRIAELERERGGGGSDG